MPGRGSVPWQGEPRSSCAPAPIQAHCDGYSPSDPALPLCDVGYCSVDLAMTHGLEASRRFTRTYAAATGTELADLARWQCLWTANAMRWIKYWITGLHQAGINLSLPAVRQRLDKLADRTLHSL